MGDIADWLLSQELDAMYLDPDFDYLPFTRDNKVCRYCKTDGLYWKEMSGLGWRLINPDGSIHSCREYSKVTKGE